MALTCPAPISQIPSRPPIRPEGSASEPGSSQGAARPPSSCATRSGLPDPPENEGQQERRSYVVEWTVSEGDSALENIETARQLFRVALLPADKAKIQAMSLNQFLESARLSAVQHLHEVETLISLGADYKERARRSSRALDEAERKLAELELHKKELLLRVGATEDEVKLLSMALEEEKAAHTLARSELRAAEARLAEAQSLLAVREQRAKEAEQKAERLEAQEKEAQERAQNAVRLFRESEEFQELLEEEAVNGLIQGFNDFCNQLRQLCPDFDLNLLQPGAGVEGLGAKSDETTGEAAPEASAEEAARGATPEVAPEGTEGGEVGATAEGGPTAEAIEVIEVEPGEISAEDATAPAS
ncbi:stress response protein NST1-like [Phoenix dactylifera]|uniref:Stress response protein NST1-like n=1 Tax=Phoenix dactylifera TaxID=42345 RepID=A0A8B8ZPX7_PHODC|nr:stress response protein NST1-like [Phoenix dactylifera]